MRVSDCWRWTGARWPLTRSLTVSHSLSLLLFVVVIVRSFVHRCSLSFVVVRSFKFIHSFVRFCCRVVGGLSAAAAAMATKEVAVAVAVVVLW